jgi:hypothetical protein
LSSRVKAFAEEVGVEDLAAQAAVEAFDVGALGRLAGLNVVDLWPWQSHWAG